jgi:hypothetical protein
MLYRYLCFKIGILGLCAWIIDHFHLDVPVDLYMLMVFEIVVLLVVGAVMSVMRAFR